VTPSGQTRNGKRGAHGWNKGQAPIVGFSNAGRLAEIVAERAELAGAAEALSRDAAEVGNRIADLRSRRSAHQYVVDTTWLSID
ncbi:hypothetical protein, partial [Pseudomonas sp. AB12(2023)]